MKLRRETTTIDELLKADQQRQAAREALARLWAHRESGESADDTPALETVRIVESAELDDEAN